MTSLNPVYTVGHQVGEALNSSGFDERRNSAARAGNVTDLVGIPEAESRFRAYPHQLSGGLRQRDDCHGPICEPKLLIADGRQRHWM